LAISHSSKAGGTAKTELAIGRPKLGQIAQEKANFRQLQQQAVFLPVSIPHRFGSEAILTRPGRQIQSNEKPGNFVEPPFDFN
jgi:hypothetical protein